MGYVKESIIIMHITGLKDNVSVVEYHKLQESIVVTRFKLFVLRVCLVPDIKNIRKA